MLRSLIIFLVQKKVSYSYLSNKFLVSLSEFRLFFLSCLHFLKSRGNFYINEASFIPSCAFIRFSPKKIFLVIIIIDIIIEDSWKRVEIKALFLQKYKPWKKYIVKIRMNTNSKPAPSAEIILPLWTGAEMIRSSFNFLSYIVLHRRKHWKPWFVQKCTLGCPSYFQFE